MILISLGGAIMQIVYFVGAVCAIWCIWDLWANKIMGTGWKILVTVLLLLTSWLGLLVYLLLFRGRIPSK